MQILIQSLSIYFEGDFFWRTFPAFTTRFFSAAAKPPQKKELKHAAQSGAQVKEFSEPNFLKITFSSKYNQPFLRYMHTQKTQKGFRNLESEPFF